MPSPFAPFSIAQIIKHSNTRAYDTQRLFTVTTAEIVAIAQKPVTYNRGLIGYPEGGRMTILDPDMEDEDIDFGVEDDFDTSHPPNRLIELNNRKKDLVAVFATFAYLATVYDRDLTVWGWEGRLNPRGQILRRHMPDIHYYRTSAQFHEMAQTFDGSNDAMRKLAMEFYCHFFNQLAPGKDTEKLPPRTSATLRINMMTPWGQSLR